MLARCAVALTILAASSLGLAGCGEATDSSPSRPLVITGEPAFDTQEVAWAHLFELHYGSQTFTVQQAIRGLEVSDYGFFLDLAEDPEDLFSDSRWAFFDGAEVAYLGSRIDNLAVSPDGRYVGWIDRAGPWRPAGRIAEVVVVDLSTGQQIFANSEGMGGEAGDDLGDRYEELQPDFLGFDADSTHAYWRNASGPGERMRWELGTDTVERAETSDAQDEPRPVGIVVNAYAGARQVESADAIGLGYPNWSPSGSYVAELSDPAHVALYSADTMRRLTVEFGSRAQYFGGWLPGDRFYVVTTAKRIEGYSLTGPDPTRGRVVVCSLPAGTCRPGAKVPGLRDLVVPHRQALLG